MIFTKRKNKKQLEAVFNWLSATASRQDFILLEQGGRQKAYRFDFPLKYGDQPKQVENFHESDITFYIQFSDRPVGLDNEQWFCLFETPELKIYENRKRSDASQFRPLRWGLGEEEKKTALKIARKALKIYLNDKKKPKFEDLDLEKIPLIFGLKTDLDVSLWTKGVIRGSWVVENNSLADGIISGAIFAARDPRFKPLEPEELEKTKIEIILFSDLKIPVSQDFIKENKIIHNKGYVIAREEKRGWFLPEVFNMSRFKDLNDFLMRLGTEKAGLRAEEVLDRKTEIKIFEVQDFIESNEPEKILNLRGPIAEQKNLIELEYSASLAADWLVNIQEENGNLPPIINPLIGESLKQIDWPRLAFCGLGLAEYGIFCENIKYIEAGKKVFDYLNKYIISEDNINIATAGQTLTLAYLGQLALVLDSRKTAQLCAAAIMEKERFLNFEPIRFAQISLFFILISQFDRQFLETSIKLAAAIGDNFKENIKNKKSMDLASWAEAPNLFLKLYQIKKDSSFLKEAEKMVQWLLENQMAGGGFKSFDSVDSDFAYARGTGKIVEVLANILLSNEFDSLFNRDYYIQIIKQGFNWLISMQYLPDNSYFVPEKNLGKVIGGFRHDYFNTDLWIDSAGHFILTVTRFLKTKK